MTSDEKSYIQDDLDYFSEKMLEEASIHGIENAFSCVSATGDNIGIVFQQLRCSNLAWALNQKKVVDHGSVVAVVGAGFSGLYMAVSLALMKRCIVYLIDRAARPLDVHRAAYYRYVNPNLNSRDLPTGQQLASIKRVFYPPLFYWEDGLASEVAEKIFTEFKVIAGRLPIFEFYETELIDFNQNTDGKISLNLEFSGKKTQKRHVDVCVFCTGYGTEQNPFDIEDFSYWRSGNLSDYRPRTSRTKERVLISGCGDSGLTELMQYAFKNFEQGHINAIYPSGSPESYVQPSLEQSAWWSIRYRKDTHEFGTEVLSELKWFINQHARRLGITDFLEPFDAPFLRHVKHMHTDASKKSLRLLRSLYRRETLLFHKIRRWLAKIGVNVSRDEEGLELAIEAICALPIERQLNLRDLLVSDVEAFASLELDLIANEMTFENTPELKLASSMLSNRYSIIMNGVFPTVYSPMLSPINIIFLRLCEVLGTFRYVRGKIVEVEQSEDAVSVTFANKKTRTFDRVLTRYGLSESKLLRKVKARRKRHLNYGEWLLENPIDGKNADARPWRKRRQVLVATKLFEDAFDHFEYSGQPSRHEAHFVDRQNYSGYFVWDRFDWSPDTDFSHLEDELRSILHKGKPVFVGNRR